MNWIEGFRQIYEDQIEILVLFPALLPKLSSSSEDHVDSPSTDTEATLPLSQNVHGDEHE